MLFDKLFIRHWDTWSQGTRSQLFAAPLHDGKLGAPVLLSEDIDGDVPSKPFGEETVYTFSTGVKNVVFTARITGRTEAWSTTLDLDRKSTRLNTSNSRADRMPYSAR